MSKFKKLRILISFSLLIVFLVVHLTGALISADAEISDMFLRRGGVKSDEIIIIAMDDDSINEIGDYPWHRSVYTALLDNLSAGGAAVIAFDVLFAEPSSDEDADETFMESIAYAENVVLPLQTYMRINDSDRLQYDPEDGILTADSFREPLPMFASQAVALGHINARPDDWDGQIRRTFGPIRNAETGELIYSFAETIYREYCDAMGMEVASELPTSYADRAYVHYVGPPATITYYPFFAALDPDIIDPSEYKDKIILIGSFVTGDNADAYFTPASGVQRMFGVEIHATIISNLLSGDIRMPTPPAIDVMILVLLCLLTILCYFRIKSGPIKLICFIGAIVVAAACYTIIISQGRVTQIVATLLALVLIYISDIILSTIEESADKQRIRNMFGRYMAPQILSKLIDENDSSDFELGGTRREISVMFVDIRGFTPMSEVLMPEQIVEILNQYLTLVTDAIFKYDGTLDKYIGDAAMALYNAPFDQDEHVLRAVKSALYMQQHSKVLAEKLMEEHGRAVHFGVGINTGFAVVGNIGSPQRMDYTAIGDVVNTAARLESNAKPGQILISEDVYELVKDIVEVEFIGGLSVKGRAAEVQTYSVLGLKEA